MSYHADKLVIDTHTYVIDTQREGMTLPKMASSKKLNIPKMDGSHMILFCFVVLLWWCQDMEKCAP